MIVKQHNLWRIRGEERESVSNISFIGIKGIKRDKGFILL